MLLWEHSFLSKICGKDTFYIKTNISLCRVYNWDRLLILKKKKTICLGHCVECCIVQGRCSIRWNTMDYWRMAITYASAWCKHLELGHPPVPHGPVQLVGVRSLPGRVGESRWRPPLRTGTPRIPMSLRVRLYILAAWPLPVTIS